MLHRLIIKVTKFQLLPTKRLSIVVKNISGAPCQIGLMNNTPNSKLKLFIMIPSMSKKIQTLIKFLFEDHEVSNLKWRLFKDKKKQSFNFWLKTLRDSKVKAAKDRGKRFQSRLAASF